MCCIISHNETIGFDIMGLCTNCCKGFITYHKTNDISVMKKHMEQDHLDLLWKYLNDVHVHPQAFHDQEQTTKWQNVTMNAISGFFFFFKSIPKRSQDIEGYQGYHVVCH